MLSRHTSRKTEGWSRHRSQTPGGTLYELDSTFDERRAASQNQNPELSNEKHTKIAANGFSSRRDAAGFINPKHSSPTGLHVLERGAVTPPPAEYSARERKEHILAPDRHFRAQSAGESRSTIIQGHSNGVLGHGKDAAQDWNEERHKYSRQENFEYNQQPDRFARIEPKSWSAASGSKAPKY